jgi:hypothetical protein
VKKLIAVFAAVALAVGTVGYAAAQEKKAEEKKAGGEMKKTDEKKMKSKTAKGTVKSAAADSLVVAGKDKGKDAEWTFAVDAKTTIKKDGKAATAADVAAGDTVSVKYMEHEGKMVAQNVDAKPSKAEKKAEKAEKKAEKAAEKAEKKAEKAEKK